MNAIVLIALRRPYTFVVLAILILLFGAMSVLQTPTDIFPPIKIPVIAAVWTYNGLSPSDMSGRDHLLLRAALTTTVSGIEHIESQSLLRQRHRQDLLPARHRHRGGAGAGHGISQTVIKQLPAGTTPPNILVFDASSVPVLDLQIAAENMTPAADQRHRVQPDPSGAGVGPRRRDPGTLWRHPSDVEVDLDQAKLLAHGLTAKDVGARPGFAEHRAAGRRPEDRRRSTSWSSPTRRRCEIDSVQQPAHQAGRQCHRVPARCGLRPSGRPAAAEHRHGEGAAGDPAPDPEDRRRLHPGGGRRRRAKLPEILKTLPPGITITPLNDASNFVRASIEDVVQEMVTAAVLAGIAVLLFVGSWRSTLIVAASIPLSILSSIMVLSGLGRPSTS